jgi:hypothetical protein
LWQAALPKALARNVLPVPQGPVMSIFRPSAIGQEGRLMFVKAAFRPEIQFLKGRVPVPQTRVFQQPIQFFILPRTVFGIRQKRHPLIKRQFQSCR